MREYVEVESGLDTEIHQSRSSREKASLKHFLDKTRLEFNDMKTFHDWIFLNHAAYSSSRFGDYQREKASMSAETLKTY